MAGEFNVAIAGQNAIVEFQEDVVLVQVESIKLAKKMVRSHLPGLANLGRALRFLDVKVKAQLGERKPIELFPKPSWLVRFLVPPIRTMVRAARQN